MNNKPAITIKYLDNYDLSVITESNKTSPKNDFSSATDINNIDSKFKGKKPLFFSGGSVDNATNEVSGCILDGSYTFFEDKNEYKGFIGNSLSIDNINIADNSKGYPFENAQYITIRTTEDDTFIHDILIYFDEKAEEFATEIQFSNALKYDRDNDIEITDTEVNALPIQYNDKYIFVFNFGEERPLKEVRINFNKWSKKNSLLKILRIVTGLTETYDNRSLMNLDYTRNKVNDSEQLRFGISNNECHLEFLDKNLLITSLYQKDLIYKNIPIQINIGGTNQGTYYLDEKESEKGSGKWKFDCIDRWRTIRDIKVPMLPLADRTIYELVNTILSGQIVRWEREAMKYCQDLTIESSYFNANQTLYDLLLKCCQVGLLRIYIDNNNRIKITSGVN